MQNKGLIRNGHSKVVKKEKTQFGVIAGLWFRKCESFEMIFQTTRFFSWCKLCSVIMKCTETLMINSYLYPTQTLYVSWRYATFFYSHGSFAC